MIQRIFSRNKQVFLRYNQFRKDVFCELAPREGESVLYLLPWLLSVNHPACPGYVPELEKGFRVYNVDGEPEIRKREPAFKRSFGVSEKTPLFKPHAGYYRIEGLYTIGSVGTVSQTAGSDCDIWVCYDKEEFDETAWIQLNQKINLIRDWMDLNLKMPVFFFLSDISDIRQSRFGALDAESSGSAQKEVLKEEFYRTCMVICGKIPLWWVCYDPDSEIAYSNAQEALDHPLLALYDFIDFGNLERVETGEYIGAALWQFHKALRRSLKSIIKLTMLRMQLDSPREPLPSHRFREHVLSVGKAETFTDPMVFTMRAVLDYYDAQRRRDRVEFLKKCFYLRCELKPYDKRDALRKSLSAELFGRYPIDIKERLHLSKYSAWNFDEQVALGDRLLKFLIRIYKEIAGKGTGAATGIDRDDLKVLGRKILVSYQKKPGKISVLQKPTGTLNLSDLTLSLDGADWKVSTGGDTPLLLVSDPDIVSVVGFLVWNGLFSPGAIQMEPNPSSVTLQEVFNLGSKLLEFFGTSGVAGIELSNFLKKETIVKLKIVVSFERSPWEKDIDDYTVVYKNNWGELFVRRVHSPKALLTLLKNTGRGKGSAEISYYVQRNCTAYEKIIERTQKMITLSARRR